jgi:hypothetical protein
MDLFQARTYLFVYLKNFDWAKFRQTKGAVKLHLLLDHDGYLPVFAHITDGKTHEIKIAQTMKFPTGSILAIDKGYIDYELFWNWTEDGVFFVTRQKDKNAHYRVLEIGDVNLLYLA